MIKLHYEKCYEYNQYLYRRKYVIDDLGDVLTDFEHKVNKFMFELNNHRNYLQAYLTVKDEKDDERN